MTSQTTEIGPETAHSQDVLVVCDVCQSSMSRVGWVPQPDGEGGLRRFTVFRCDSCGRLFDALWGYRDSSGSL